MSFSLMRLIDSLIGSPLCWLLGLFIRRPKSLGGTAPFQGKIRHIVCVKFLGLGSIVQSLPLLQAFRDQNIRVTFWTFSSNEPLLRLSGLVDQVIVLKPSLSFGFITSLLKNILTVRRAQADAFVDLEPTANFTALLSRLSGIRIKVGFLAGKPTREKLFSHLISYEINRHISKKYLAVLKALNLPLPGTNAPFPALRKFQAKSVTIPVDRPTLVININASDMSWQRCWPESHWIKLCQSLLKDRVHLAFVGTKAEYPRVAALVKRLGIQENISNLAGKTTIPELLDLLMNARLLITNDSGILHLGAWTRTPSVALFGPETPEGFAPETHLVTSIYAGLHCSPCLPVSANKVCHCLENRCMEAIHPETVLTACQKILKESFRSAA